MNQKNRLIEIIVGFMVLALCATSILIIYNSGSTEIKRSKNSYLVRAIFERADGIVGGTNVTIGGVKIGQVASVELDENNYSAVVSLHLDRHIKIPVDSSAEIVSSSLLGDKYISIVAGSESDYMKNGDTFEFTQSSINIEQLISKFMFGLESNNAGSKEESSTENSESAGSNLSNSSIPLEQDGNIGESKSSSYKDTSPLNNEEETISNSRDSTKKTTNPESSQEDLNKNPESNRNNKDLKIPGLATKIPSTQSGTANKINDNK